jgi:hypothetical protein
LGLSVDTNPDALCSLLVRVGLNKVAFKPTVESIKARYYEKYRGVNDDEDLPSSSSSPATSSGAGTSSDPVVPATP